MCLSLEWGKKTNFLQKGRGGGHQKRKHLAELSAKSTKEACVARYPRHLPAGSKNSKWRLDTFNILYAKSNSPAFSRVAALSSPLMLYLCCFKKHWKRKKTQTTKYRKGRRIWNVVWLILGLRSLRWNFKSYAVPEVITQLCTRGNAEGWISVLNPDFKLVSCIFKKPASLSWCSRYSFPMKHSVSLNSAWKELYQHSGHISKQLDLLLTNGEVI